MTSTAYWELRVLDDFRLLAGGEPCHALPRKGMALLGFLALQRDHSARREAIAMLLWEHAGRAQARVSLRQLLSGLRKFRRDAPALVEVDGDAVKLSEHVCVDADAFERLADAGRGSHEAASAFYRTDLLESVHLPDAPAFHDWLAVEQTRLRNRLVTILVESAEAGVAEGGDLNQGMSAALRLLRLDPYNEIGHRCLMQVYSRQGRSALAINQYRSLCALLGRELQVQPETATIALYEELMQRRRAPVRSLSGTSASGTGLSPARTSLPPLPRTCRVTPRTFVSFGALGGRRKP